jgi:predicted MFS family arabinose efflux permease
LRPELAPWYKRGLGDIFRALRHRDFRLLLFGQVVSLIGTWMQGLAQNWLIYRLTHSTVVMGTVGFCQFLPVLLLGPFGGITADRHSRRKLVILTQSLFLVQASALAGLALTGLVTVPLVMILACAWGVINAFDVPARQSLYIHLVGKEDLANAIALNSMTFNAGRVIGPSIAGFCVAAFGEGVCFAMNAVTFLAVLASLIVMRSEEPDRTFPPSALQHVREGLWYAWRHSQVRMLLLVSALANTASSAVTVLGPVFADRIFQRGAAGLGLLTGALGFGAVIGTAELARNAGRIALDRVVLFSALLQSAAIVLYAIAPWFEVGMLAMALWGYSVFRLLSSINTLIQVSIEDEYRGRVMSLYTMTVVGLTPVGNLASGVLATWAGVRGTAFAAAALMMCAAAVWAGRVKK